MEKEPSDCQIPSLLSIICSSGLLFVAQDSGGFQMVSLSQFSQITEEGAMFSSPYDGQPTMLTVRGSLTVRTTISVSPEDICRLSENSWYTWVENIPFASPPLKPEQESRLETAGKQHSNLRPQSPLHGLFVQPFAARRFHEASDLNRPERWQRALGYPAYFGFRDT